jgi:hypothetical protein
MENLSSYLGLLVQVPLVGIFVWFSLKLVGLFLAALDKRDEQWQQFIAQQQAMAQEATRNMAVRFADEIRVLGKEISELKGKK